MNKKSRNSHYLLKMGCAWRFQVQFAAIDFFSISTVVEKHAVISSLLFPISLHQTRKKERKKERRKSRKSTVWLSHYRLITVKKSFGQYLQVSFLGYCNLFSNFILLDWCCRECSCEEHIGCGSPPSPPPPHAAPSPPWEQAGDRHV